MVNGLEEMVTERLSLWRKRNNGGLPTKIILYRDGVSEGQYDQVLRDEVPHFEAVFQKLYGKTWPKLTVIIVGKRHHTRFYPTRVQDANYNPQRDRGSWNPKPGTIVDRHITSKIVREFYLQAHQGLQGTARPAHYVVLRDDIGFEADEMEQFTHNLCYLFNRATKAVSICPPAYYADLLCERGRAYLFNTLAENNASDAGVFNAGGGEWTSGVHPRLAETSSHYSTPFGRLDITTTCDWISTGENASDGHFNIWPADHHDDRELGSYLRADGISPAITGTITAAFLAGTTTAFDTYDLRGQS
ncbi:hypothetical protein LTR53_016079 [Teratosphaeriaceae sp. CCFEE 6253]|nr:hypothetical protein LTR53_016079 [Teratosphaeriaceae sp. CCFEE 6253]